LLRKAQPQIVRRIADLSALLQEDKSRRDAELGRMASKVLSCDGKRLDLTSFFEYDISLRRMFLHRAFPRQSYRQIAALLDRLTGLKSGKKSAASLRELLKEPRFRNSPPARAARTPLTVPGTNWCPRWNLKVTGRLLPRVPPSTLYRKPPVRTAYFDADKLGSPARWTLRAWAPGDRFRPLGLGGTRKLQDFFTDRKVARGLRGRMPLIEAGGLIRWIPGHRTDEDSKIDGGTRRVIELQIEKASGR
jgi:tRNA(Ile)-lysidine synthetase-like protein